MRIKSIIPALRKVFSMLFVVSSVSLLAVIPSRADGDRHQANEEIYLEEFSTVAEGLLKESISLYEEYNKILTGYAAALTEEEAELKKETVREMFLKARFDCREALELANRIVIDPGVPEEAGQFDALYGRISRHARTMIYEYAAVVKPALEALGRPPAPVPVPMDYARGDKPCAEAEAAYNSAVEKTRETCGAASEAERSPECLEAMKRAAATEKIYVETCEI